MHPASHRTASGWRNCFLSTSPAAFALMIKKLIIYWPKDLFLCVFPREAGSFNFTTLSRTSAGRCGGIIIIRAENSHYSPPRAHSLVYLHVCSIWVPYGSRALKWAIYAHTRRRVSTGCAQIYTKASLGIIFARAIIFTGMTPQASTFLSWNILRNYFLFLNGSCPHFAHKLPNKLRISELLAYATKGRVHICMKFLVRAILQRI